MGGVHGKNRLGGNSLLDCVVFGRVTGAHAARYQLSNLSAGIGGPSNDGLTITVELNGVKTTVNLPASITKPSNRRLSALVDHVAKQAVLPLPVPEPAAPEPAAPEPVAPEPAALEVAAPEVAAPSGGDDDDVYTMEDVAAHNTKDDCWTVVQGGVYDLTEFRGIHPGGGAMIDMVAGKDGTDYFEELHKPEILEEIGEEYRIGVLAA